MRLPSFVVIKIHLEPEGYVQREGLKQNKREREREREGERESDTQNVLGQKLNVF